VQLLATIAVLAVSTTTNGPIAVPLTLEQALAQADAANARLATSRYDPRIAAQSVVQSRASFGPALSVAGALLATPPGADYWEGATAAQSNLQLELRQPLYEGGALRGQLRADEASLSAARSRLAVDRRDVALQVRSRFSEVLADDQVVDARTAGLARLQTYVEFVQARKASGAPVQLDLLRVRARIEDEEANLADAERTSEQARIELNVLIGRDATAPLVLAPLPEPAGADPQNAVATGSVPDVAAAAAQRDSAQAEVQVARSARRPHLAFVATAGLIDPGIGAPGAASGLGARLRDDLGATFGLQVSWDLWNMGALSAQIEKAHLVAAQASAAFDLARTQAELERQRAIADVRQRSRELATRRKAVPIARDTYVVAESLYRGGTGTSLDVLDAYRTLLDAEIAAAQATFDARVAEATLLRWMPE
jgi:outer membrane protein/S-layer protein transport system outer membrane protein